MIVVQPPLLRRSAAAPPVRYRRPTRPDRAVQRAKLRGKHRASRKRELGGARAQRSPAARPAVPCRTWTPVNLHGAEGALVDRASAPLAVLKRAGGVVPAGSVHACSRTSRALRLSTHATAPVAGSKRAAAGRGGRAVAGWWLAEVVVAQRRRCAGAAVEQDMRSGGAGAARRREGAG